jgi:Zn-dependent oligopeptidase
MYHEITPDALDVELGRIWRDAQETFSGFPHIPADSEYHPELSFGHFYSYGPRYISYDNSLAIAKEMLQVWKDSPLGLHDLEVSRKYRKAILEKGSTVDATEMVQDFLGRAHTTQGYLAYLNE